MTLPTAREVRLSARDILESCHILDTPPEETYDDIALMAAEICDSPYAGLTLIDGDRQWFKARVGISFSECSASGSLCREAWEQARMVYLPDASQDPAYRDHKQVVGPMGIRFYLGVPIVVNGEAIGALCIADFNAKHLSAQQLRQAQALARQASTQLELRQSVAALKDARARAQADHAQRRRFFELSTDLLIITDHKGRIVEANHAWQCLGYQPEALVGKTLQDLIHPEDLPETIAAASHLFQGDASLTVEHRLLTTDGGARWVRTAAAADTELGRVYATCRDITEARHLAAMKDEFVSTVSHELRTPLTSIRGALGLATSGALGEAPAPMRELLDIATRNSERLVRLVNDILDVARIESGRLRYDMQPVDLLDLVRDAIDGNRGYAEKHATSYWLRTTVKAAPVHGDADRLRQVLDNLLSNAAKFTTPGTPIAVRVQLDAETVQVEVQDQGPGIPADFHARVFERFAQADGSTTRALGGSGLGLYICRAIAQAHDGAIDFESQPGEGATFRLTLPRPAHQVGAEAQPRRPRILVCEDDPDVANLVRRMLQSRGFEVTTANTAADAQRAIVGGGWDIVTLDLGLPDQDGMDMLRGLSMPANQRVPIVVLSGRQDPDPDAAELGVRCWLTKPVDQGQLVRAVRATLDAGLGGRPRVLHIEDDMGLRQVVARLLQPHAEVIGAGTLSEAMRSLEAGQLDAVILDLGLPDGDGTQVLERLSRIDPGLPVVLFTGREPTAALVARVETALVKTRHDEQHLVRVVERLVGGRAA